MSRLFSVLVLSALAASSALAQEPPDLGSAAERVRAHDEEGALAALDALPGETRSSAAASYLRARLLASLGRRDEAARAFELAREGLPAPLARDASSRRARLLARLGRCEEATATLATLDRLDAIERALRAECALVQGQLDTARSLLAREAAADARDVDTVALRLALAEAELRAEQRDTAIATLRSILLERPEHPDIGRITETYEALAGSAPTFTIEERLARAERLDAVRRHRDAVAELDGIGRIRDRPLQRRLLHARGMALFHTRHAYAEAADVLTRSARAGGATAVEDAFHAARARSRAGDDARAAREYRAFARRHRGHARAVEAEYLAAWLALRLGQRGASRAMERFLAGSPTGRLAREARWHLALDAFRHRRFARAATLFGEYAGTGRDALVRGRGLYWRARALTESGAQDDARRGFEEVIAAFPLHWYALLAHQRLEAMGGTMPPPLAPAAEAEAASASALTLPIEVRWLRALGLDADARDALRPHEAALRREHGVVALAEAMLALGAAGSASRLVSSRAELSRAATGEAARIWSIAYPRAFEPEVTTAASAQGLPPELLWGIMRQESGYDPDAISYADAIGLLQMLPSTAARTAAGLGIPFERDMLFEPSWNTRLAATLIARLVREHGVPLCFAAYNAGGHRVRAWLAQTGEVDLDLFVEEIPFDQTRNYVRRVTSHLAHYLYAAAPERGWPVIDLPARVAPASTSEGTAAEGEEGE